MRKSRLLTLVVATIAAWLLMATPALASVNPIPLLRAGTGTNTEMTFTSLGPGHGVSGFIAQTSNPFDPVSSGYPAANPPTGFDPLNEGFAGVIVGTPADGSAPLSLYCIDIRTETRPGFGYELGTWSQADVPNVGYVAQILNSYYPAKNEPATLADPSDKAAAVQAAIWFFSDRYVLNTEGNTTGLREAVVAIVNQVIAAGPLVQPPPPSLTITPSTQSGPVGTAVGPFAIATTAPATVAATGANMFSDAAATAPIGNGATVASGTNIWLASTTGGVDPAVLQAVATATVPSGNVYLYDGNIQGVNSAQKLILAQPATLKTTVDATAQYQPPGALTVTKTIDGPAAGTQGDIVIQVECDGEVLQPPFVIPAGTPAGSTSFTYTPIPAGAQCQVIETADGHTALVTARKARSGANVVIPPGGTATATVTDTYAVGSLIVNKTITGTAAGQQGQVVISVNCGGVAQPDFVIPAGAPPDTTFKEYTGIPAGTVCTATETSSGATGTVTVESEGSPQTLTISPNGSGTMNITDTYEPVIGSIVVTKQVTGSAAGQQSAVGILVACGGSRIFAFVVPPGSPGGSYQRSFTDLPAGATCTVAEVVNGSNDAVDVTASGGRQQIQVEAGGSGSVALVNNVEAVPTEETIPDQLPATGNGTSGDIALVGLILGLAGGVLVFATRRRLSRPH